VLEAVIWIVVIVLFVCFLGIIGMSVYVAWQLAHPIRRPIENSPEEYGLVYSDIEFPSRANDAILQGWFIPVARNGNGMTLIFAHGYAGNRLERGLPALALAASFVEAGYQIVMFDFRNSGQSSGTLTTVGSLEKYDLLGAVDWVREHVGGSIGLIGFSMGGSTSLLAAAEEPAILGVVADSPFCQLKPYLQRNLSVWSRLPRLPFTPLILAIIPRLTKTDPSQVDALAAMDRIYPRPVLFIHSTDDTAIPYTQSEVMWSKHPDRFEFWKTALAPHVGTYKLQPQTYTFRVLTFFDKLKK
jgi:pimeloyl-ACP methyl ester carboxylesterase